MSADAPECSVVIPTRDRSGLLTWALRSALGQRDVELEVLVIDDGSTDETAELIGRVGDPRIRLIRHASPLGVSVARNRGIEEARGPWVAFLDDDDVWAPEKLALQLRELRATGLAWAYAGAVHIAADHRVLGGAPPSPPEEVRARLPRANLVPAGASSVVVRKGAVPPDGFDPGYRHCADWDLWIRLARRGPPAWVPSPLVGYRVHTGNASVDTRGMLAELEVIERRYGGPVDRVAYYRHLARVCLRMSKRRAALGYYVRAAARSPRSYLLGDFRSDVLEVLRAMADRGRARLGRPARLPELRRMHDPHRAWKDQARAWLQPLAAEGIAG